MAELLQSTTSEAVLHHGIASCNLQGMSTLEGCKISKYMFSLPVGNAFPHISKFFTN